MNDVVNTTCTVTLMIWGGGDSIYHWGWLNFEQFSNINDADL